MNMVLFSLALTVLPVEGNCPLAFRNALREQLEQNALSLGNETLNSGPFSVAGRVECSPAPVLSLELYSADGAEREPLRSAKTNPAQDFTPAVEEALEAVLFPQETGRPWLFGGLALGLTLLWGAFQVSQGAFQ
jgi:hypothetical protein